MGIQRRPMLRTPKICLGVELGLFACKYVPQHDSLELVETF